jgi:hypothetical protein
MTAQTILPANSVTGGFEVANSAMFDGTDKAAFQVRLDAI